MPIDENVTKNEGEDNSNEYMLTFRSEFLIVHKNGKVIHTHPHKQRPDIYNCTYYHGNDFGFDKYDESESKKI